MELNNTGIIKCQKCRHILLLDIAKALHTNRICDLNKCSSYNGKHFIYLLEEKIPDWIKSKVEEEQWTKGKLHCENCKSKVGSFDFISGRKCECEDSVLPPVYFVTSQVDRPIKLQI